MMQCLKEKAFFINSFAKFVNYIWAILHKTFTIEKLVILTRVFYLYIVKLLVKFMLTGVFRFYQMVKVLCNRALLYFIVYFYLFNFR